MSHVWPLIRWISIFKQGRQPDGSPRNPKYMMNLDKIPDKIYTC